MYIFKYIILMYIFLFQCIVSLITNNLIFIYIINTQIIIIIISSWEICQDIINIIEKIVVRIRFLFVLFCLKWHCIPQLILDSDSTKWSWKQIVRQRGRQRRNWREHLSESWVRQLLCSIATLQVTVAIRLATQP